MKRKVSKSMTAKAIAALEDAVEALSHMIGVAKSAKKAVKKSKTASKRAAKKIKVSALKTVASRSRK